MSASNGGRGRPPTPPESQQPQGPPPRQIVEHSLNTSAERVQGHLALTFLVSEAGEPVRRTFIVGEKGRKALQEAVNGGLEVAAANAVPPEKP